MRGHSLGSIVVLVIFGVIIADVLIHVQGAQAAYNAGNTLAANTFNSLLGGAAVVPKQ
jgi:hypothetical protein